MHRPLPSVPPSPCSPSYTTETLYSLLGLGHNATSAEIKKAYKVKALATHPDKLDPLAAQAEIDAQLVHFHKVCPAPSALDARESSNAADVNRYERL